MSSIYLFPILYVLSIYLIPILGWLGITLPTFFMFVPLGLGIINYLVAFLLNKKYNDNIFASAVIIKYSLIPLFIFGGLVVCGSFFLVIIPHLSILTIGGVVLVFIGYLLMILGSAYQIAYIRTLIKDHNINVVLGTVLIIFSFVFSCDVITVMILSFYKNKYRKITIFVIVLLVLLFVIMTSYLIYFIMSNGQ